MAVNSQGVSAISCSQLCCLRDVSACSVDAECASDVGSDVGSETLLIRLARRFIIAACFWRNLHCLKPAHSVDPPDWRLALLSASVDRAGKPRVAIDLNLTDQKFLDQVLPVFAPSFSDMELGHSLTAICW